MNLRVQIKKHYQGQPKQIAAALWGNSAAQYRYKHVIVVEEDINPADDEQVEWAYAHRVNAGEGGVVIFPGIFGSPIDPSTPLEDRDVAQLGTGLWNRMLIDATRSWKNPRQAQWGNERFPPTVRPAPEDEGARAAALVGIRAGRSLTAYLRAVCTLVNVVLRLDPTLATAAMIAIEMPAAIRPYSIAVAPVSSQMKRRIVFVTSISSGLCRTRGNMYRHHPSVR